MCLSIGFEIRSHCADSETAVLASSHCSHRGAEPFVLAQVPCGQVLSPSVTCDLRARQLGKRDDQKDNCGTLLPAQGLGQGCKCVTLAEC